MRQDIQDTFLSLKNSLEDTKRKIEELTKKLKDARDSGKEDIAELCEKEIAALCEKRLNIIETLHDLADSAIEKEKELEQGVDISRFAREEMEKIICPVDIDDPVKRVREVWRIVDNCRDEFLAVDEIYVYLDILLLLARNKDFDSYLLYLEKNRIEKDRLYLPKRKQFLKVGIIESLQDMIDDKLDILTISMPPGTGKTTLSKFFISAIIGWFPTEFNLFWSHSADIARMYYDGVYDILSNNTEYTWQEIFAGLAVTNTNAKMGCLNVGKYKPFQSLQTTSTGAENAGKVRASKFLMLDDLIGKLEEALNINQLEKLWRAYSTDSRQRKIDGCKEIHIATRWSVHDVIGKLQRAYEGNNKTRTRFIAIPDIDEETGESNFDYEYDGFSKRFYEDQALLMDDISYRCLYKNQPIEREGLLYHDEDLRRYLSLPLQEPDAILAICDVKNKGTDYMFMPVMCQYGNDYYLVDCVCDDNSDFDIQYEKLSDLLVRDNVLSCEFESNTGGDRVAFEVQERVTKKGGSCTITTHPTETNKETRIIVNADWVKRNVLFRDKSLYTPKEDYGIMMNWLLCYSTVGKNNHDDVPDGLANFRLFVDGMRPQIATVEAAFNPFRSRGYY